eukprot:m.220750 g.220750  ORF g.220750 m.220750 type:complete len:314 (-) comp54156_c0_seq3:305-1246(-)
MVATTSVNDFFCFYLGTVHPALILIRYVEVSKASGYTVILQLAAHDRCVEFARAFNGRPFSSLESEVCSVMAVTEVADAAGNLLTYNPASPCPICLDALAERRQIVTILVCNHVFHADCIRKCHDVCPLCRYPLCGDNSQNQCEVCDRREGLWMCLTCGSIGCGRQAAVGHDLHVVSDAHALKHFEHTSHPYAQNIETHRVWDYLEDRYVHRLGQSETGEKLVEIPGLDPDPEHVTMEDSKEALILEYTHRLNAEIVAQRERYLSIIEDLHRQHHDQVGPLFSTVSASLLGQSETLSSPRCNNSSRNSQTCRQ